MAQDDYYYEIQLTNKQLVFYFLAGATGLILSFLAGVMVGRGVDAAAGEVQAKSTAVQEERVVTEEATPAPPPVQELTYAQRLEAEKVDEGLAKPAAGRDTGKPAVAAPSVAPVKPAPAAAVKASPVPAKASPKPVEVKPVPVKSAEAKPAAAGAFTIQVGAFKDRASAELVMTRLKGKGFAAYVVAPAATDGLFNVRVGSYQARSDAERVQVRLRDEEKFKPFIVKQ
ncbi:MAG TPA: SPOR domain-containing protein [Vicinamibacteria bacterium]|nr:SPOR domain-containing protein [Vicinamibacteria bacterium]